MAKKLFVVAHPKLTLKVDGKMKRMVKDSEITMDEKHAQSLLKQGKLLVKGENKPVTVGGKESKKKDDKPDDVGGNQ